MVIPATFAIALEVIGKPKMALFVSFGGVATLVMAGFAGGRRERFVAYAALALAGSVLLTLGTAVSSSVVLAALVTCVVGFLVFFAGVLGPTVAASTTALLLVYVLAASWSAGIGAVPERLAGWWLASVAGALAALLFSVDAPRERLQAAAAGVAAALAEELQAMLSGSATKALREGSASARDELAARFTASTFSPTGLAAHDQALANAIELLDWCGAQVEDIAREHPDLSDVSRADRDLVAACADALRASAGLLGAGGARPDLARLEELRLQSTARLQALPGDTADFDRQADVAFDSNSLALTVRAIGADVLVAQRVISADGLAAAQTRWFLEGSTRIPDEERALTRISRVAARHASVRSVWLVNAVRCAVALAAAVAVADLSDVQHGFWVVLGALSVLRTTATSTGATAVRALAGTIAGFVLGGALVLAIGGDSTALWIVLPIAVFVTGYAPGTAPFAVAQAAFTVFILVLFNLAVPSGWRVGVVRVEDVAIGCGVSLVVGALLWPRGVASIVADDLADAYRAGARYLREAIDRVCALSVPGGGAAMTAVTAGIRLDHALRAFLSEQGAKQVAKSQLWRLVGGAQRLRLTATATAQLPRGEDADFAARSALARRVASIEAWYEQLAKLLEGPRAGTPSTLAAPSFDGREEGAELSGDLVWLRESVDHLTDHLGELVAPAQHIAEVRRRPWWR